MSSSSDDDDEAGGFFDLLPRRKTQDEMDCLDAKLAVEFDKESDDEPYASERVIESAWRHAARVVEDPMGVARTLPWDVFDQSDLLCSRSRSSTGTGDDEPNANNRSVSNNDWVATLLRDSPVLADSHVHVQEDNKHEEHLLITGAPMYPSCYVDRELPGVAMMHPADHHPTNAVRWNKTYDDWPNPDYIELSRSHPGDDCIDNAKFDKKNTSAENYDERNFCPTLTKAGSRLWSISFAAAATATSDTNPNPASTSNYGDMKACYPGQLLVRFDLGRNMMIYDCFEFVPTPFQTFDNYNNIGIGRDVCTESELVEVEALLRKTRRQRREWFGNPCNTGFGLHGGPDPTTHGNKETLAPETNSFSERLNHIPKHKLCYLINWIRFKRSRLLRVRFPMDSICGARLVILDHDRPNGADISPPKGDCRRSDLGKPGDDDFDNDNDNDFDDDDFNNNDDDTHRCTQHGSFEMCNETLEPIGMLVLEFKQIGSSLNSKDEPTPFASTILWPRNWRDRRRLPMDKDWTPDAVFSKSRRHYIIGDASEIKELANTLVLNSPQLEALLRPRALHEVDKDQGGVVNASLRSSLNSLAGTIDVLKPESTGAVRSLQSQSAELILQQKGILASTTLASASRQFKTKQDVHDFLRRCGLNDPERVNSCLKAGLLYGHLSVPSLLLELEDASAYLDTVLLSKECGNAPFCSVSLSCTVKDVLYQSLVGNDDENIPTTVAVECGGMFCSGKYLTGLCCGVPDFTRLNHNHCTKCPSDFGKCVGFYQSKHCSKCGCHFVPRHSCCECDNNEGRSLRRQGSNVDTHMPKLSCWEGCLRGCSKTIGMEATLKRKLTDKARKALLMLEVARAGHQSSCIDRTAKTIFPENQRELSRNMELDQMSTAELKEFHWKIEFLLHSCSQVQEECDDSGEENGDEKAGGSEEGDDSEENYGDKGAQSEKGLSASVRSKKRMRLPHSPSS